MSKKQAENNAEEMVKIAYKALDDKQASDIRILDLHGNSILADYFIICTGKNQPHIQALMNELIDMMAMNGYMDSKVEGRGDGYWIVVDMGDIIIQIFNDEARDYYNLEKTWANCPERKIEDFQ